MEIGFIVRNTGKMILFRLINCWYYKVIKLGTLNDI